MGTTNLPRILIVDDHPDELQVTVKILESLPADLQTASSGAEALAVAMGQEYALVLMKVQMIGLDGFATAVALRSNRSLSQTPIFFITEAGSDDSIEFQGYESGAVDCLPKPISPIALRSKVDVFLSLYCMQKESQLQNEILEDRVKQRTEELREACEAAEKANSFKDEFLANMSHELRTPLTAILGFAELMAENPTVENNREFAGTIVKNGRYLLELINDILDLSKIEAGKLVLERTRTDIRMIVSDVASLMQMRAEKKGLYLHALVDKSVPQWICTDPVRLRQVIVNIVGNAIKFTQTGGVQIVVRHEKDNRGEECRLQFEIIDTGIGIPADKFDQILKPFNQADGSTTRKFGGTGLGLSITKQVVEMFGGELSISSVVGEGSTFSFTVTADLLCLSNNCQIPESVALVAESNEELTRDPLSGTRILLVEDGPDNQRLLCFLLEKAGAEIAVVDNGQIGFETALSEDAKGKPFDIVLMDMQMPVMDGYEATRQLRCQSYDRPIIALTANAMATDRRKCLDAGCDDYLTKPIDRDQLIRVVMDMAKQRKTCTAKQHYCLPTYAV